MRDMHFDESPRFAPPIRLRFQARYDVTVVGLLHRGPWRSGHPRPTLLARRKSRIDVIVVHLKDHGTFIIQVQIRFSRAINDATGYI
jgi:hypothetical protein